MRRYLIILALMFLSIITINAPAQAQSGIIIQTFSADSDGVALNQLNAKTARVPVSWNVLNRPIYTNLVFEQYLPSENRFVNVELPRPWSWVASSGNGVTSPVAPGSGADEIQLRLSVINIFSNQILVERYLSVPIVEYAEAEIVNFSSSASTVARSQLVDRTARIPVSWAVVNRAEDQNLVFEQALADGSYVNVELPRPWEWVASNGQGTVAPILPGGNANTISLRLSVINRQTRNIITQSFIDLTIDDDATVANPVINTFRTFGDGSISESSLRDRSARILVEWSVANRVDSYMSLSFQQQLEDGSWRVVELPRPDPYIASSGTGMVAPYHPGDGEDSIEITLFVHNSQVAGANNVLTRKTITIPIFPDETDAEIVSFDVQPRDPQVGDEITVSWDVANTDGIQLTGVQWPGTYNQAEYAESPTGTNAANLLPPQGSFTYTPPDYVEYFEWTITYPLYSENIRVYVQSDSDEEQPEIVSFDVQPRNVQTGDDITITWDVSNTDGVQLMYQHNRMDIVGTSVTAMDGTSSAANMLPPQGSFTYTVPEDIDYIDWWIVAPVSGDSLRVEVENVCAQEWFVDRNQPLCAESAPYTVNAAYQPFQNGFMLWVDGEIWIFYPDGAGGMTATYRADTWNNEEIVYDGDVPNNLLVPERGFGHVWTQEPSLQESIGFATAPEQGYSMQIQTLGSYTLGTWGGDFHTVRLPDNRTMTIGVGMGSVLLFEAPA